MRAEPGLERDELWRQYGFALEEYRFQVTLNWDRTRYLLTLDVGIIPAATALLGLDGASGPLIAAVYFAGVLVSVLGIVTLRTQRSYYRSARNSKAKLEELLDLGDLAIRTTPGMASTRGTDRWRLSVHRVLWLAFGGIGLVHLAGIVVVAIR